MSKHSRKQLAQLSFAVHVAQVLEDLSEYPQIGRAIVDGESQEAVDQEQLDQHVIRSADIICALNFSVFLLKSRYRAALHALQTVTILPRHNRHCL